MHLTLGEELLLKEHELFFLFFPCWLCVGFK